MEIIIEQIRIFWLIVDGVCVTVVTKKTFYLADLIGCSDGGLDTSLWYLFLRKKDDFMADSADQSSQRYYLTRV